MLPQNFFLAAKAKTLVKMSDSRERPAQITLMEEQMTKFEELQKVFKEAEADAAKFYGKGNKSAGTRLRKAMSKIKTLTTEVRKETSALAGEQ